MIVIKIPKEKIRNPYALDALSRKAGKIKSRKEKRKGNPKKQNWDWCD